MKMKLKDIFKIEKKPVKGLLTLEWVMLGYLALTLVVMLFAQTKLQNPESMLWGRVRVVAITAAMWAVYRLVPCRLMMLLRVAMQMALLAWWYPDTYELNRLFPNLDHVFATWEQGLFGFQPALTFAQSVPSAVVSELMSLGYASYYPMIALTALCYFFYNGKDFLRCATVIMASFFLFYVVYDFLPVVGPTYYYKAVGLDEIARGVFPNLHDYFASHTDCLPTPGYTDGFFYQLVESAKEAGERPTAAFPSSHVGVSTICVLLAMRLRRRWLMWVMVPLYAFLCLATVYIQAHYAIDALAGLLCGCAFYFVLWPMTKSAGNR